LSRCSSTASCGDSRIGTLDSWSSGTSGLWCCTRTLGRCTSTLGSCWVGLSGNLSCQLRSISCAERTYQASTGRHRDGHNLRLASGHSSSRLSWSNWESGLRVAVTLGLSLSFSFSFAFAFAFTLSLGSRVGSSRTVVRESESCS
jgi:hypothetical protein